MSRAERIEQRILEALKDMNCHLALVSDSLWSTMSLSGLYRFGWAPPIPGVTAGGERVQLLLLSPTLLAKVTEDLSEAALDSYLTVVEAMIFTHLDMFGQGLAVPEQVIVDRLYDSAPGALLHYLHTNASALDRGVVAAVS